MESVSAVDVGSATNPSTEPVEAYYKIEFDNFSYYLQTLSVTIGRRVQVSQVSAIDAGWRRGCQQAWAADLECGKVEGGGR